MATQIPAPPVDRTGPAPISEPAPGGDPGSPSLAPRLPRQRMSWPGRILAVLFVLAVAAVTAFSLRPRPPVPVPVQLIQARRGPITRVVTAAGHLQAATEVKLS